MPERGHSASNAMGGRTVGWTPGAVSGGPPLAQPEDEAVAVSATSSPCLVLGGLALPAASRTSVGAFASCAATIEQQRLAAAARTLAEADRTRIALLAAVSHDLRTPLAAAKAAVGCLRSGDIKLTADDHDELLATADESLDLLTRLAASLLDVSRLQAGVFPVFPRPADLQEIITRSLGDIGKPARAVTIRIPPELPPVMVDPPIMERVITNVVANALRYSPEGSPPLLTASAGRGRVELRVIDRGPGVPQAGRDQIFVPFRRLGDTEGTTGVGLGLTVARGLTEAMHGTLEPEQTPGGGLTMAISVPAAAGQPRHIPARPADSSAKGSARPGARPRSPRHPGPAWHRADSIRSPGSGPSEGRPALTPADE